MSLTLKNRIKRQNPETNAPVSAPAPNASVPNATAQSQKTSAATAQISDAVLVQAPNLDTTKANAKTAQQVNYVKKDLGNGAMTMEQVGANNAKTGVAITMDNKGNTVFKDSQGNSLALSADGKVSVKGKIKNDMAVAGYLNYLQLQKNKKG